MATSLQRLFLGLQPVLGPSAPGTCASPVSQPERAAHGSRRAGHPGAAGPAPGVSESQAAIHESQCGPRACCAWTAGFTVDGELLAAQPDRVVSIRADRRIRFVRAR